jgi:hypothetical protein
MSRATLHCVVSLCQDCLRVHLLGRHAEDTDACECGGELCSCSSCSCAVVCLETGCRDPKVLGISAPLLSWDAKTGGVFG